MNTTEETESATPAAPPLKLEVKLVKHKFNDAERLEIGNKLAAAIENARLSDEELDKIKQTFKSRTAAYESEQSLFSNQLRSGFEMREAQCWVRYDAKARKKTFFLEEDTEGKEPVLVEDMLPGDYQAELVQAESKFLQRQEIQLFKPAFGENGNDTGILVVGQFGERWFSALRIRIGNHRLDDRLDSEQRSFKARSDAVRFACKRAGEWFTAQLGKDAAKGFEKGLDEIVEANKEREE